MATGRRVRGARQNCGITLRRQLRAGRRLTRQSQPRARPVPRILPEARQEFSRFGATSTKGAAHASHTIRTITSERFARVSTRRPQRDTSSLHNRSGIHAWETVDVPAILRSASTWAGPSKSPPANSRLATHTAQPQNNSADARCRHCSVRQEHVQPRLRHSCKSRNP
jgi:hypothetical protein